ncbi:MAG: DUF5610 domain-containing protein [Pseudomonadota bacterium]
MSIPITSTGEASAAGNALAADGVKPKADALDGAATSARAQAELNVSIVQASLSVSIASGNEPLALLYKSAITSINEQLRSQFGEDAIQNASSQDNTAEGTANRIVALSTAFYDAYRKQNASLSEEEALKSFLDTIGGGVERGFKEARDILQGLQVLNGDVAGNIDRTYELVQQGLKDFAAARQPQEDPQGA